MNFLLQIIIFFSIANPLNTPGRASTEYIDSAQVENYYPDAPIKALPKHAKFHFTKMLNLLIPRNADRSKIYGEHSLPCEIVSEKENNKLRRVSLTKEVSSTLDIPYDENRVCIDSPIPVPEGLDTSDFDGKCKVEKSFIIQMTGKCLEAIQLHDKYHYLWSVHVSNPKQNPRLFAIPGLKSRMELLCNKDLQTTVIDFEGELKMVCYGTQGFTMARLIEKIEQIFRIEIEVPVPSDLHDINYRRPAPGPRPPVSI